MKIAPEEVGSWIGKVFGPTVVDPRKWPRPLDSNVLAVLLNAAMAEGMEAAIAKVQAEVDHAVMNGTRLEPAAGRARGEPGVRATAVEAALDWLRSAAEALKR